MVGPGDLHVDLKLGWTPAPPDPRNLRFAAITTPDLPPPPRKADWLAGVKTWQLYRNNEIGDCEVCACAHATQSLSLHGSGSETIIDERDVIAAYSAITGYDPRTGANDTGIRSLDMLGHWRTVGIGGHRITAYVEVNVADRDEVKTAIALGGSLLIGADMPLNAGDQFKNRKPWTVERNARARPGSWGGHAIHIGKYDGRYLTGSTWGTLQRMTWSWFEAYVAEAFCPISLDWFNRSGMSPTGLDLNRLMADLRAVTSR